MPRPSCPVAHQIRSFSTVGPMMGSLSGVAADGRSTHASKRAGPAQADIRRHGSAFGPGSAGPRRSLPHRTVATSRYSDRLSRLNIEGGQNPCSNYARFSDSQPTIWLSHKARMTVGNDEMAFRFANRQPRVQQRRPWPAALMTRPAAMLEPRREQPSRERFPFHYAGPNFCSTLFARCNRKYAAHGGYKTGPRHTKTPGHAGAG